MLSHDSKNGSSSSSAILFHFLLLHGLHAINAESNDDILDTFLFETLTPCRRSSNFLLSFQFKDGGSIGNGAKGGGEG